MRLDRLAQGSAERALDALFAGPLPEALGRSLAEHDVIERVASELPAEELAQRLVESPAFRSALTEVLSLPEVRAALTSQATGFGDEITDAARRRASRFKRRNRANSNRSRRSAWIRRTVLRREDKTNMGASALNARR